MEVNIYRALIEAIYKLDQVNNEISEVIALHETSSAIFLKLDEARAEVIAAVSMLRSIVENEH